MAGANFWDNQETAQAAVADLKSLKAIDNESLFLLSLEILLKPNKLHKDEDLSSSSV